MSKFKVGDKVRLKSLEKCKEYCCISESYLETMMGKTLTIGKILDYSNICTGNLCFYTIKGEQYQLCLHEEMFELVENTFYKTLPNNYSGKLTIEKGQVVEKEEEKEILDEVEKEYLRAVIKPFRKKVVGIKKIESIICHYKECISISVLNENNIYLPYFKKDTMYKGMEERKFYTIEELGL